MCSHSDGRHQGVNRDVLPPVSRAQLHELRFCQLVHRCQEAVLGAVEPLCQAVAGARHLE